MTICGEPNDTMKFLMRLQNAQGFIKMPQQFTKLPPTSHGGNYALITPIAHSGKKPDQCFTIS
jgi:hypothetical protein